MEPRSRETTLIKEDLDFIVDEDPDYVPNDKYINRNISREKVKTLSKKKMSKIWERYILELKKNVI